MRNINSKVCTLLLTAVFSLLGVKSFAQTLDWAKSFGSSGDDFSYTIVVDSISNCYLTGKFSGSADFDPGVGTTTLTSVGGYDLFLAKFDALGDFQWAINVGSSGDDEGRCIAVDGQGNCFIAGNFSGAGDFDPGAGIATLSPVGGKDIYFAKYDASGNYVWAKSMGSSGEDNAYAIALDQSDNCLITGYFEGSTDFDPGTGTADLSVVGSKDVFFAKYDSDGNYVWANRIGSSIQDYGYGIVADDAGNCYITGDFQNSADFDPGTNSAILNSSGGQDAYFAKYDADGNYLWAKNFGSSTDEHCGGIVLDGNGFLYITGYSTGLVDFDPGSGSSFYTTVGGLDVYLAKYDVSGNYIWSRNAGSTSNDWSREIIIDSDDNLYITGNLGGTADFDPGTGSDYLTLVGGTLDVFFAKYDSDGNYSWASNIGSSGNDEGWDIAVYNAGDCYISGNFAGTTDFDPEAGTAYLLPVAGQDVFFAKYSLKEGVNEFLGTNSTLVISPNPFSVSTSLKSSESLESATLIIYDATGKEIKRMQNLNGKEIIIQANGMKCGMYCFSLFDKMGVIGRGKLLVD